MKHEDVKIGMKVRFVAGGEKTGVVEKIYSEHLFKRPIMVKATGPEWFYPHTVWVSAEEIEEVRS